MDCATSELQPRQENSADSSTRDRSDNWLESMASPVESKEIERKFLIEILPPTILHCPHQRIDQGYLAITSEGSEVRIRKKGDTCFLTVKSGTGLIRQEREIILLKEQFLALWSATESNRLVKDRYILTIDQFTVEVDVYHGRLSGLVIAEVEFRSPEESTLFLPPAWFGREVTEDERYRSKNLLALKDWHAGE
jgi:adenylate cyclase